jgi:hypothetical protein
MPIAKGNNIRLFGETLLVLQQQSVDFVANCFIDIALRCYIIRSEFKAEANVLKAFREGAEVVIGGVITVQTG